MPLCTNYLKLNSVMKLHLRETPRIQERMRKETTAEIPLFHGLDSVVRSGLSEKTLIYLLICNVGCLCK